MVRLGNEPAGHGRMRASRGDREQAVELLKTAFVQDRLTKNELDTRVGQALVARTYADLDAVTVSIPLSQTAPVPWSAHRPGRSEVSKAVKSGAGALGVVIVATGTAAGVATANPFAGVFVAVLFAIIVAIPAGFAALVIRGALYFEEESRRRKRSRGRTPPRPGPGGRGSSDSARGGDPALASALWTARLSPSPFFGTPVVSRQGPWTTV